MYIHVHVDAYVHINVHVHIIILCTCMLKAPLMSADPNYCAELVCKDLYDSYGQNVSCLYDSTLVCTCFNER